MEKLLSELIHPSSQMGGYSLDIKGDNTNAYLHMGNPFPTFAGGAYPIFRIKTTDSTKTVAFESMWGGDNALHNHMEFAGGKTAFYDGMTGAESARFNGTNFLIGATSDLGARLQVRDDVSGTNPLAVASPATNSGIMIMNYSFAVGRYSALSLECCNASSVQSASIVAQSVSSGQTPNILFTGRDSNSSNAELARIDSSGNFLPGSDNSKNLGSSSRRWANLYTTDLQLSNKGSSNDVDGTWGDWTLQEGENKIFMINNRTGKKYSLKMEEE